MILRGGAFVKCMFQKNATVLVVLRTANLTKIFEIKKTKVLTP